MSPNAKRICCRCTAAAMLLIAFYAAMGVLQAASIYEGERALQNVRVWGSITVISLTGSVSLALYAIRLKKTVRRQ